MARKEEKREAFETVNGWDKKKQRANRRRCKGQRFVVKQNFFGMTHTYFIVEKSSIIKKRRKNPAFGICKVQYYVSM